MNEKNANLKDQEAEAKMKFSTLKQEDIDCVMLQLGPYREMSLEEIRKMTKEKMGGIQISDVIRQEREEGW